VYHRDPARPGVGPVDSAHQDLDLLLQAPVGLHVLPAGDHELHQGDPAVELRIPLQGPLEGPQPLRNALGVVQPVHACHQLARKAGPHAQGFPARLGGGGQAPEGLVVDADGAGPRRQGAFAQADPGDRPPALDLHVRDEGLQAGLEVVPVPLGLEGQEGVLQEIPEEGRPPGHLQEDVRGREGDVEEEGALRVGVGLVQDARQGDQVVVVDPDEIARSGVLSEDRGELAVHLPVGLPVFGTEAAAGLEIVEEGPGDLVRETLVEELNLPFREEDRKEPVAAGLGGGAQDGLDPGDVHRARCPHPADPEPSPVAQDGGEGGDQASRPGTDGPLLGAPLQDHREAVGDHDESGWRVHRIVHLPGETRVTRSQPRRKARSSPGGQSQRRARVGRQAERTSTGRPREPRAKKACSSVRSSPR